MRQVNWKSIQTSVSVLTQTINSTQSTHTVVYWPLVNYNQFSQRLMFRNLIQNREAQGKSKTCQTRNWLTQTHMSEVSWCKTISTGARTQVSQEPRNKQWNDLLFTTPETVKQKLWPSDFLETVPKLAFWPWLQVRQLLNHDTVLGSLRHIIFFRNTVGSWPPT